MEGHHPKLEADASDGEHDPGQQQRESGPAYGEFADARELHRAGSGINEGHAEEKEAAEAEARIRYLIPASSASLRSFTYATMAYKEMLKISRPRRNETKWLLATSTAQPKVAMTKQEIQLFAMAVMIFEVLVGKRCHSRGGGDDQAHVEQGISVHEQKRRHLPGSKRRGCIDRDEGGCQSDERQPGRKRMIALEGDGRASRRPKYLAIRSNGSKANMSARFIVFSQVIPGLL